MHEYKCEVFEDTYPLIDSLRVKIQPTFMNTDMNQFLISGKDSNILACLSSVVRPIS